jgi:hypothetical protein
MKLILRTNANDPEMVDVLEKNRDGGGWTCWAMVHKDMFSKVIKPEEFGRNGIEMELTRADK